MEDWSEPIWFQVPETRFAVVHCQTCCTAGQLWFDVWANGHSNATWKQTCLALSKFTTFLCHTVLYSTLYFVFKSWPVSTGQSKPEAATTSCKRPSTCYCEQAPSSTHVNGTGQDGSRNRSAAKSEVPVGCTTMPHRGHCFLYLRLSHRARLSRRPRKTGRHLTMSC